MILRQLSENEMWIESKQVWLQHLFAADAEGFSNDLNEATVTERQLGPL